MKTNRSLNHHIQGGNADILSANYAEIEARILAYGMGPRVLHDDPQPPRECLRVPLDFSEYLHQESPTGRFRTAGPPAYTIDINGNVKEIHFMTITCQHKEVFPDGSCAACGAFATSTPGSVEHCHHMVPWPLPFATDRDHDNFAKVITGQLRPLSGLVLYVQLARPVGVSTAAAWLDKIEEKGWQGKFEGGVCGHMPRNHYLKIWGPHP